VWMGYDKRRPLNEYAYTTALPLWVRFVKPILQGTPVKPFIRPSGVVISPMHPDTGIPAERASSDTLYEYFQKATLDRYRVSMALNQSTQSAQSSQEPLF
jgi:membrane carboxypeptidase/penicillin-binding protein